MQNHLSRAQLAARTGRATGTLAHWAKDGTGPKFIKIGNRVAYRLEDVEAWERAHTHESTASIDTSQQQAAAQASVAARKRKAEGKLPDAAATGATQAPVSLQAGCN